MPWRSGGSRRPASRSRWTGGGTSWDGCAAARPSCRRSGPDRTSTRCPRAVASTARWGWSRGSPPCEAIGQSERTLGVAVFRDEETGCHGSRWRVRNAALPGSLRRAARRAGAACWLTAGAPLGVVSSIAGIVRCSREFAGRADHAGTTPMAVRRGRADGGGGIRPRGARPALRRSRAAVATVGQLEVEPGAANVIPESVRLTVDARAPDQERLDRLVAELGLERGALPNSARGDVRAGSRRAARGDRSESPRRWSSFRQARATTQLRSAQRASRRGCSSSEA